MKLPSMMKNGPFQLITVYAVLMTAYAMYLKYKMDQKKNGKQRLFGIVGLGAALASTLVPAAVGAGATVVTAAGNAGAKKLGK